MKTIKIAYWTSTSIIAVMMTFSAYSYLTNPSMKDAFLHLGFPDYFRVELAIAKLAGIVVLLIPFQIRIKEWAYAGFAITFISAFIGHAVSGDPVQYSTMPVLFLIPLVISYVAYHKMPSAHLLDHNVNATRLFNAQTTQP